MCLQSIFASFRICLHSIFLQKFAYTIYRIWWNNYLIPSPVTYFCTIFFNITSKAYIPILVAVHTYNFTIYALNVSTNGIQGLIDRMYSCRSSDDYLPLIIWFSWVIVVKIRIYFILYSPHIGICKVKLDIFQFYHF